jgi:hypothetical protein
VDALTVGTSVVTFVATAGATYGALRVRLADMQKAIVKLQDDLGTTRAFAEAMKELLKDKLNVHEHVHAEFHTRLALIEQAKQADREQFGEFRREFKDDTRAQNKILEGLKTSVMTMARASGQMQAIPRVEPDSDPPSRPEAPRPAGYRPPQRSWSNEKK